MKWIILGTDMTLSLLVSIHLAPSEVLEIRFTHDGTNFNISWDEPLQPNGILTYNITLTGINLLRSNQILFEEGVVTEQEFLLEVASVPYTFYTASVVPQTGGGVGPETNATLSTDQESK